MYTIDTIPAKIFFKIQKTSDITLLSDKKEADNKLRDTWKKISAEYQKITGKKNNNRIVNLMAKISKLKNHYRTLSSLFLVLKTERNNKLEVILKENGYKLTNDNFVHDLETAEREATSVKIRISRFETELKRLLPDENNHRKTPTFEDALIPILAVLEIGYVSANTVTLLEFISLEKQAVRKIEALKKK